MVNERKLIEELEEIKGVFNMPYDELKEKYPYLEDDLLLDINTKYPYLAGIVVSKIEYLIVSIKS